LKFQPRCAALSLFQGFGEWLMFLTSTT